MGELWSWFGLGFGGVWLGCVWGDEGLDAERNGEFYGEGLVEDISRTDDPANI